MSLIDDLKAKAAAAVGAAKSAVSGYLTPDTTEAAANFDYRQSQRDRTESAQMAKRINAASKTQRVSGRAKSRANELAKIHGRSDEEKIQSKAVSERNARVTKDLGTTVLPGGAVAGAAAKVGYAKKGIQVAKTLAKGASKLGKGSIKKGIATGAKALASRTQKAGVKGVAKYAAKKGTKLAKYKGKLAIQGELNKAATDV